MWGMLEGSEIPANPERAQANQQQRISSPQNHCLTRNPKTSADPISVASFHRCAYLSQTSKHVSAGSDMYIPHPEIDLDPAISGSNRCARSTVPWQRDLAMLKTMESKIMQVMAW